MTDELWDAIAPAVAKDLLLAAIDAFSDSGFHGTSTRDIAQRAGLSPAGVYVYYPTKESLLFRLAERAHVHVLETVRAAVGHHSPAADLHAVMRAFVEWHARHVAAARVAQNELGALTPEHFAVVRGLRRELTGVVRGLVEDGVAAGAFRVDDVGSATRAMLSMGIDVIRWYRPDGRLGPEEMGERYAGYCLAIVDAESSARMVPPVGFEPTLKRV